jgi:hypothetical protein
MQGNYLMKMNHYLVKMLLVVKRLKTLKRTKMRKKEQLLILGKEQVKLKVKMNIKMMKA